MHSSFFSGTPWQRFKEFIHADANRFIILQSLLNEMGLPHNVLEIAGNRHFMITPSALLSDAKVLRKNAVMLVAHYDRAEGSPGANDNSAGVFLLLETAAKLKKSSEKNWAVIFTDKEELKTGESIEAQGAYTLALGLKRLKMEKAQVFCFDACGVGDTLIISTTANYLLKKEVKGEKARLSALAVRTLEARTLELRDRALETARNLGLRKALLAPTPFSDDAGFLRAGFPAQTITMLPSSECIELVSALRKDSDLAGTLINAELRQNSSCKAIPQTWLSLNSPRDSYLRLTPEHYRTVTSFAQALCKLND